MPAPGPGGGDVIAGLTLAADNPPAVAFARPDRNQMTGDADGKQPAEPANNGEGVDENAQPFIGNALAGYISASWARNKRSRDDMEKRLLGCLRARRGVYGSMEYSGMWSVDAGDAIYLPYAAAKMRAAEAALRELLLPDGERPWGIDPTPVPELPPDIEQPIKEMALNKAKQQMVQMAQGDQGRTIDLGEMQAIATQLKEQMRDDVFAKIRKEADERAHRMEETIQERMDNGNFNVAMSSFIQHFCTFPTAVLKGPFLSNTRKLKWERGIKPNPVNEPTLTWEAVNPFDCFPAPEAMSCQDGDFIERIRMSRRDLFNCIGLPGYNEQAVRNVLANHATGSLRAWLQTDAERRMLEGQTQDIWLPDYLVDALHYWGSVEGKTLIEYGLTEGVTDPLAYYEVDAVMIGQEVIRCELNDDPLGRRPYFNASYDEVPGAFWGNSIFELMRDCQAMINACARALNANLGLASGPIVVVDMGRMAVGQDPKSLRPLDIIQADSSRSPNTAGQPAYFLQAESRSAELLGIIDKFEQKADDLTGIPKYTEGAAQGSGAAGTFGGLSMLMGQAAKGFRRAVANIDRGVVKPTVEATYVHEMLYNPDDTLKGDCSVNARGAAAVLIKEHLQQTRSAFLQLVLGAPVMQDIMGKPRIAALMRAVSETLEMETAEIVPNPQELAQEEQQKAQVPPQPTPDAQLHAETEQKRIDSKEKIEKAKLKTKLASESMIHPGQVGAAQAAIGSLNGGAPPSAPNPNAPPQ